jgi:crotonobetainyl-CoA:carnitine CoA-transferase CaiB-like acyl-CoA transferase/putative sterol carrier protein
MANAKEIIESIPHRFRKEKAANYSAIVHLDLSDNQPLQFTVTIQNGNCQLLQGLHEKADCTVKCTAENYVALETGKLNPQWALVSGKVKVSDVAVMIQFTKCFKRFEQGKNYQSIATENTSLNYTKRIELNGPLKGVRIVDFTRLLPGPIATMFLAQQGAEVIKVEDPHSPDYIRNFEPQYEGNAAFYLALNACKKSLAINFLEAEGKEALLKLIERADILIEQFRPGVMQKFGLDYESLKKINPKLIYISITGYGVESSKKSEAGHDLNYIAACGLPYISGITPTLPGFQAADVAGGAYMAMNAATTALFQREKTGSGDYINVAMTDCILPLMALPLAAQQFSNSNINPQNFELAGSIANYNIYECADGKFVALAALEPKFWNNFCDAINKTEWKEKAVASTEEMQQLKADVSQLFLSRTQSEWLNFLKNVDCCISPINDVKEVLSSAYFNEQNMFIETTVASHLKLKILRHPLSFQHSDFSKFWNAPLLGEDTASILSTAGIEEKNIKELFAKGIVK